MNKLTRRDFLKLTVIVGTAGTIPLIANTRAALSSDISFPMMFPHGFALPDSPTPTPTPEYNKTYLPMIES